RTDDAVHDLRGSPWLSTFLRGEKSDLPAARTAGRHPAPRSRPKARPPRVRRSDPANVPENHETFRHTGDVLAERRRQLRHPKRVIGHILEGLELNLLADLLLLGQVGRIEPGLPQLLGFGIVRPAEPGPLAVGAQRQVARRG